MEAWDRDKLYGQIWDQPLVKVAPQYGISAVMLGKVCRKLQIPLPGRGYWVRRQMGKVVERIPLPPAKDLPIVTHNMRAPKPAGAAEQVVASREEPNDTEYLTIKAIESRTLQIDPEAKRHKLVVATERKLAHERVDRKGMLDAGWDWLDLNVSKNSLDRALAIMNAVITALAGC